MKKNLNIKIFADGADIKGIEEMSKNSLISGFTTNPTLMRKANVKDYKSFSMEVLKIIEKKPISFEVFADDFLDMERQAMEIASWGSNVYVKIPVTNTKSIFSGPLIKNLANRGVQLNVTAVMTLDQTLRIVENLSENIPAIVSVFAGRIADTGIDPIPVMSEALRIISVKPKTELIWASPRELLNIFQANDIGCHIITATGDILKKMNLIGKDLEDFSLETVDMFYRDAKAAGYKL